MLELKLDRPLAVFDIESTGTTPKADRIIELAFTILHPDGRRDARRYLLNPGVRIPAEATAIHGIRDADVAGCPTFAQVAQELQQQLDGCDLAGFNVLRFDIPLLQEEFKRAGITFDIEARRIIDAQRIFHQREPRNLSAALAFYCGEAHTGAHGAAADVEATIRVLQGQFTRYADLPRDMAALHEYCDTRHPAWVDRTGRLRWVDGHVVLNFGQRKGTRLDTLLRPNADRDDVKYVEWILRSDFPEDTKDVIRNARAGTWPLPPDA